ncbi:MAG: transglutaminase TgpA family protein [Actinomycetota bacterium]
MDAPDQATGDRRFLVIALGVLGVVTGAAFGRVFLGSAPAARLAVAGGLAVAVAAATQRRHLGLALLGSLVALVAYAAWVVFPETGWLGLPTWETLVAISDALGRAPEAAAREVAPARPLAPLMIAGLIAVWSACTAAHTLAVRSRSTVLPLLPGAALLAFAGVVAEDGSRPGYVLLFLAAAFVVLFTGGVLRLLDWGPVGRRPGRRVRLGSGKAAARARVVGMAAIAVAVLLPGLLPGFGGNAVLAIKGPGGRVGISPIVDIRPSLLQNPPATLFSVRATRPAYWRMVALDKFNGRLWTANDLQALGGEELEGIETLPGPTPFTSIRLEHQVEIEDLSTSWLPVAYQPETVALGDIRARHDPASGMIVLDEEAERGMTYEVVSQVAAPPPAELETIDPTGSQPSRFTELPPNLPLRLYAIVQQVTGTSVTPFDQVLALQEYLRTFTYDEKAPAGHGTDDILFFLERSRRGYCEQFAGTMTVMVRALGYPARVAVGFLPGSRDPRTGGWVVTSKDIHAWTEVYFPSYGWLAFEPTPTRSNPVARYLAQVPGGPRPDADIPGAGGAVGARGSRGQSQREAFESLPTGGAQPFQPVPVPAAARPVPWGRVALGSAVAAAAIAVLMTLGKIAARRLMISRATSPRRRVIAAYGVFEEGAADVGLGRRPGETPWEYRRRLTSELAFRDGHLERLTRLAGLALYAPGEVAPEDAREAVGASRRVLADLRRHAGAIRTAAGAIRPGPRP